MNEGPNTNMPPSVQTAEMPVGAGEKFALPRIRFLQIGDIHLPSSYNQPRSIDDKDIRFPHQLKNTLAKTPLKTVFRKLYELISEQSVDGVMVMGDLTDIGNLDGYKACCRYIGEALQLGTNRQFSHVPFGIVPGNHDVDRNLAGKPGYGTKFRPLSDALRDESLPDIPLEEPRVVELRNNGFQATAILLNSCWGCGEQEFIPEMFREPISNAISAVVEGADRNKALALYYNRQLDTPAMTETTISSVVEKISTFTLEQLPIVVAHHNLLPQRVTRLAPYTELVNSGVLRNALLNIKRPLLYLHGHIHDEPVEIVHVPNGEPLVIVSAPEITKGFNLIEIVYAPTKVALACRILPYRFNKSGLLVQEDEIRASLRGKRRYGSQPFATPLLSQLLFKRLAYWPEVIAICQAISTDFNTLKILEAIELLLAENHITVDNYDLNYESWIIRAEV